MNEKEEEKTPAERKTIAEDNPFEKKTADEKKEKETRFPRSSVRDIVFLAIVSAICLVTCAVMPLVISLQHQIFGIAQVVTGFQLAFFFAIGLYKVRKPGALLFMATFTGIIQLIMAPPMFFSNLVCGLLIEVAIFAIFRGYKKNKAIFFAVLLYNPLSLPFNYLYNLGIGNTDMTDVANNAPWSAVGMTVAVLAIAAIGGLAGLKIGKELAKAGVLK